MQQTLRATIANDPDLTCTLDVDYDDDEWMEEARRGLSMAAKMVGEARAMVVEEEAKA